MKAVLVIDEMPTRCAECPLYLHDYGFCNVGNFVTKGTDEPSFVGCPLKPLPQKMEEDTIESMMDDYSIGWNDCIEEIEK